MNTGTTQWKETTLGEVADIRRGASPRPIHEFISSEGMPWLKIADVANIGRTIYKTKERIKNEGVSKSVTVHAGDLILSNSATPGIPKFLGITACIHDGWLLLNPKDNLVDKNFLYYLLLNERPVLVHSANGSVFKNLKTEIVKSHTIHLPTLSEQKEIAKTVSSLENKIELLRKQNETLEEMARAIFHEWFVEFNFPNKDGKPYKASGGKMVESELGDIPEGWKIGTLAEMTEQLNTRVGSDDQSNYTVMSAVNTGELMPSEEYFTKQVFSKSISKYIKLKQGDFAYNPARINIGSIGRLRPDVLGAVSPVYVAFRAKDKHGSFVDYLIQTARMKRHIELFANGSVRQTLGYGGFTAFSLALPNEDILTAFEVFSIFTEKTLAQKERQIAQLQEIRDTLLPKLMSGELRINT